MHNTLHDFTVNMANCNLYKDKLHSATSFLIDKSLLMINETVPHINEK